MAKRYHYDPKRYDYWRYIPEALRKVIYEALKKKQYDILRGLECFYGISRWDEIDSVARIIVNIYEETIDGWERADKIEKRLNDNYYYYMEKGIAENMTRNMERLREGWVLEDKIIERSILTKHHKKHYYAKKRVKDCIEALIKYNFIESKNIDGDSYIRFSPIWFPYLEEIRNKGGKEKSIYIWALGKMIGHAVIGYVKSEYDGWKRDILIKPFRALMNIVNHAEKNGEKISKEKAYEIFIELGVDTGRLLEFIEFDKTKAEDIRAIIEEDYEFLYINREMIRANKLLRERAYELLLSRSRGAH